MLAGYVQGRVSGVPFVLLSLKAQLPLLMNRPKEGVRRCMTSCTTARARLARNLRPVTAQLQNKVRLHKHNEA